MINYKETPHLNLFETHISETSSQEHSQSRKSRIGLPFFKFLLKEGLPPCIEDQLKRYQIFTSHVDKKGNRIPGLEDCGFVYALKMSRQFPEEVLNQIRSIVKKKEIRTKLIEDICNEFKIHLILHLYTDDRCRMIFPSGKNNFGVDLDEASYCIEMNLFQNHFFIEELTSLSTYYAKNFENETEKNFRREYCKHHCNYRTARAFIKSGAFVRYMYEKGYFIPIDDDEESVK